MIFIEARSIREIDEKRWDAVTSSVLPMTHRWLRAVEADWRFYKPCYLLLEDDQGPCAAVIINLSIARENRGLLGWLYQRLCLVIRTPFSSLSSVVMRSGASPEHVMPELELAFNQLCQKEKRLLMTGSNVGPSELAAWQQAGFLASPQQGLNILDLPATYDLYLASLQPKDRSELRRIRKRAAEFAVRFEIGPLANDGEQIYSLLCEVYEKHGTSLQDMPFTPHLFTSLEREMPGEVLFIRGYVDDVLTGVSLCLLNGSTLWWPMVGLHYETARRSYLYFLLVDEMVRWGIEHGIDRIFGGKTTEREKQRHGFHLEERWFCYRSSFRPLNPVLELAFSLAQHLARPF